jgi:hypothetical protein
VGNFVYNKSSIFIGYYIEIISVVPHCGRQKNDLKEINLFHYSRQQIQYSSIEVINILGNFIIVYNDILGTCVSANLAKNRSAPTETSVQSVVNKSNRWSRHIYDQEETKYLLYYPSDFFVTRYVPKIYVDKFPVQLNNKIVCQNTWSFYCCKAEKYKLKDSNCYSFCDYIKPILTKAQNMYAMVHTTTTIYARDTLNKEKKGQIPTNYNLQFKLCVINPPRKVFTEIPPKNSTPKITG